MISSDGMGPAALNGLLSILTVLPQFFIFFSGRAPFVVRAFATTLDLCLVRQGSWRALAFFGNFVGVAWNVLEIES